MVDPATGDTWGISGPTFLALYGLLAVLIGAGWLWTRQQVLARPGGEAAARATSPGTRRTWPTSTAAPRWPSSRR